MLKFWSYETLQDVCIYKYVKKEKYDFQQNDEAKYNIVVTLYSMQIYS